MAVKVFSIRLTAPMVLFFFCQAQVLPLSTDFIQKRSACGGNIVAESGFIQSPNFPRNYGSGLRCTWVITVPEDSIVKLTFDEFTLEYAASCANDYLEVYNGSSTSSNRLSIFCGPTIPSPIESPNNAITINFISDSSVTSKGFSAHFSKVPILPSATGAIPETSACGGNITAENGLIRTPNFPRDYEANLTCTWVITVPEDSRVSLTFNEFELQDSYTCSNDSVEVYDGSSTRSNSFGIYCGSEIPGLFQSSNNTLTICFSADSSENRKGFSAEFNNDPCGGNIIAESGLVQSPNFPGPYKPYLKCTWVITVPENNTVYLSFVDFELEASSTCTYDFLEVYDGPSTRSTRLGVYCGSGIPRPVQSSSNTITVMLSTDHSENKKGFSSQFTAGACGGHITAKNGFIQSPNFPRDYEPNLKCTWVITVPEDSIVSLTFNEFELEDSDSCSHDSVEVYDGSSTRSNSFGIYCSSEIPFLFQSSNRTLTVYFSADSSENRKGFSAEFNNDPCGGNIFAESGFIQSPNFPGPYGPHMKCTWVITVPENNTVYLSFVEFELEASGTCTYDFVQVYDGPSTRSNSLGIFCGSRIPRPVQSSSNTITVILFTDHSENRKGFSSQFTTAPTVPLTTVVIPEQNACGGNIVAESGMIKSPNFPGNYGYNQQCSWVITVPENNIVKLTFQEFGLEESNTCSYDSVGVYDGPTTRSNRLGVYCGFAVPSPIQSSSNAITVSFVTDGSYNKKGFSAEFTKASGACGGNIVAESGFIESPNFPRNYGSLQECTSVITVPEGNVVKLTFDEFRLEICSGRCTCDYVKIYDGSSASSNELGIYCGFRIPSPIQSSSNTITVHFKSDHSITEQGFSAQFTKVQAPPPLTTVAITQQSPCGGNIAAESGFIQSPNFPQNYGLYQRCTWVITVPEGNVVYLTFSVFELEMCFGSCTCDYVKIYDGSSASSNELGLYCGYEIPSPIQSSSNTITAHFETDHSDNRKGFSAQFTKVQAPSLTTDDITEQIPHLPLTTDVMVERVEVTPPLTDVTEEPSEEHFFPGFIVLIAIGVAVVLIIAAVALYYFYPSARTDSKERVIYTKMKQ